jgi:hypothetical protein
MNTITPQPWRAMLKAMIIGVGIIYLIQLPFLLFAWAKGIDPRLFQTELAGLVKYVGGAAQVLLGAMCGLMRSSYHPIENPKYRTWLETSPWNYHKPLPLGPVHLLLSDWIILVAWTAIAGLTLQSTALYLPMVFLTAYLVVSLGPLFKTDQEAPALILAFGLMAVVRFWQFPIAATALLLGLYVVAYLGLMRSLKSFPWPREEKPLLTDFGWPLNRLGPKRKEIQASFGKALVIAFLVAGWVHAIMSHMAEGRIAFDEPGTPALLMALIGAFSGLVRWCIYAVGYASPISLRGRFWTGRWIIPKHDGVFLSMLMLPVIGAATQAALFQLHWPGMYCVPVCVFVILLAAMALPPNRRQWQLTGEHRMTYLHRPNRVLASQ